MLLPSLLTLAEIEPMAANRAISAKIIAAIM